MKAKDTVVPVPEHSESICCPRCGEEFGQESYIEIIREIQAEISFKVGQVSVAKAVLAIIENPKRANYRLKEIAEYCETYD